MRWAASPAAKAEWQCFIASVRDSPLIFRGNSLLQHSPQISEISVGNTGCTSYGSDKSDVCVTLLDQVIGQLIGAVNILGDDGIGFVGLIVDVHIHLREINLCNLLPDTLIENTKKDQAVEQPLVCIVFMSDGSVAVVGEIMILEQDALCSS